MPPLFRRKRPQPTQHLSVGEQSKEQQEELPEPEAMLTAELPLIYAPTSAEKWLAAVTRLEEVSAYKRLSYKLLDLKPGNTVLDLGCGLGDDARALAEFVAPTGRVVGVDVEEKMIEAALARQAEEPTVPDVEFARADGEQLPFADDTFDAVRIDRMLQHADAPDRVLAEVYRALKPGGRVVYATCSVLREENEDRLKGLMEAHPNLLPLDAAHMARSAAMPELEACASTLGPGLRLSPRRSGTDGFGIAALLKG